MRLVKILSDIYLFDKKGKYEERNDLLAKHWPEIVCELSRLLKLEEKWKTYVSLGQDIVRSYDE